ncbi:conserved hypothetical protein [Aspergillus terreus NIH2624]|uniref:Major facilitator superfamily (MFS) profile domain-containing protein n=1 Tax=Aspergillus terreus (strain NIH 2624 / FGSC A1156) TaxID=341663 RepID=Q0CNU2_ASPTN|nr:uncharacterized protein ATEG_04642 [Aspergillus terreus NIH2624]EAU35089.1 conserved hypothetical protein [Aspergillus terreus NIH2624]
MVSDKPDSQDAITAINSPKPANDNTTDGHATRTKGANEIIREKAAQFLANTDQDRSFTLEEEKAVLRRIDRRLLPLLLGAYFFQQLDKSSLSYVSIFGIVEDANLHGQQYSWLGSILYLAQLVMQPVAAFLLVKAPTGKLIGSAVLLWGSSLAIMAACTDFPSLLGLRFTLGAFEAMIGWQSIHVRTRPFPQQHAIIFMFCGLLTVAFSFAVLFLMPDSPMEAKYLNDREKVIAVERLRANQMGIISREWRWDHVWETLYDLKTWCWFSLIVTISIPSGGISTFGNLIIKSFGYNSFETILFNIPFGVIQIIAIIGGGWLATRFQRKGLVIVGFAIVAAIGTLLMIVVPRDQKGVLLFGFYLVCVPYNPGHRPSTVFHGPGTALPTWSDLKLDFVCVGGCVRNVSVHILPDFLDWHTYDSTDSITNLYLVYLNKKHAKKRREMGKSAQIVDESMLAKKDLGSKAMELENVESAPDDDQLSDKGFADTTDLKNEDFIFVY